MSWKSIACVAALGAMAAPALALPTISVVDNGSGTGQINIITPAAGSIGAEISLVLSGATLGGATINSAIFDTANPGDNPFIPGSPVGGDTTGLSAVSGGTSIFASYGSGSQPAGTYKLLDFTYTGTGTATADGFVASIGVLSNVDAAVANIGGGGFDPADFNTDGAVDLLDLDILGTNFGLTPATMAQGDANGDNTVDLLDLDILGTNFGNGSALSVSVPEPTAALLCAAALAGVVARRR